MRWLLLATLVLADAQTMMTGFGHAYAHPDCAPWDGAAMRVVIQDVPVQLPAPDRLPKAHYPQYGLSLWTRQPVVGEWIELPGTKAGAITFCPAAGKCEQRSGRVRFTKITGNRVVGTLRVDVKGRTGRDLVFPIDAPYVPARVLCG